MSILPSNSFYSSYARKGKGTGNLPRNAATGIISPGSSTGLLGAPPPAPSGGSSTPTSAPAPFTPTPSVLPPDPAYQAAISALQGSRDNTVAGLAQQRGAGLQQYGYTEDPTTHAVAFDPNNPYSQAALLRKHYQEAKTGNRTSYGAAGLSYDGSLQNAQNASTDSYNASDNALTNAVINFLANNTSATNAANDAYNVNAAGALGTSIQNAPNNPLYSPSAPAAIDPASVGLRFPLAPGYELYRDPVTGQLKARKVGA